MKIDEQSCGIPGKFEVCKHGGYVNPFDSLDGLQFNNYSILYDQVHPVANLHRLSFVDQWQFFLPLEGESGFTELMTQARLVARFEQSGPQFAMNPNGSTYDRTRDLVQVHSVCSVCSVVNESSEVWRAVIPEEMSRNAYLMLLQDL